MNKGWWIAIIIAIVLFILFFPFGSLISTGEPIKEVSFEGVRGDVVVQGGNCTVSSDCVVGEVCVSGSCVASNVTGCTSDNDCVVGEVCVSGSCVASNVTGCTSDNYCVVGEVCVSGSCVASNQTFTFNPFYLVYSDQQYGEIGPSALDAIVLQDVQTYLNERTIPIDSGIIRHSDLSAVNIGQTVTVFAHGRQFTIIYPDYQGVSLLYVIEAGFVQTYLRSYSTYSIKVCDDLFPVSNLTNTTNLYSTLDSCSSWHQNAFCGDGIIQVGEVCDGVNLGTATCQSFGYDVGTLSCTGNCTIDSSGCYNDQPRPRKRCKTLWCVFSDLFRDVN